MRLLLLFMLAISGTAFAQRNTLFNLKDRLIQYEGTLPYYSLGGYNITIEAYPKAFSPQTIQELRENYFLQNAKQEYKSLAVKTDNLVLIKDEEGRDIPFTRIVYITSKSKRQTQVVTFFSSEYRDSLFEQQFVNFLIDKGLPKKIKKFRTDAHISSIDFVGRTIGLQGSKDTCYWRSPNRFEYTNSGTINWDLHENMDEANKNLAHLISDTADSMQLYKVLSDEMVTVIFEGKETMARKITSKYMPPKPLRISGHDGSPSYYMSMPGHDIGSKLNGSSNRTSYYIAAEIRGRYISCILSHFDDDPLMENGLPFLLGKVFQLKQ